MTFEDYYDSLDSDDANGEYYVWMNDNFDFAQHFWEAGQKECAKRCIEIARECYDPKTIPLSIKKEFLNG